jgi:hypothetical protein
MTKKWSVFLVFSTFSTIVDQLVQLGLYLQDALLYLLGGEREREGGRGGMLKLAGFAISILMSESLNLNAPLQDWWN